MTRALRLALIATAIVTGSVFFTTAAKAEPTRLPTTFNPNQNVYMMPGVNVNAPADFEQMLSLEGAQQSLQVYVVYTLEGDEALSTQLAEQCRDNIISAWSAQAGFPTDSYLVIVCVQDKGHASNWAYAGAIGAKPARLGMTVSELRKQLDRNKAALTIDPSSFALYSVKDINARILELKSGGHTPGPAPEPADNHTWLIIGGIVIVLVVGGLLIFSMVRRKQKEEARKNALAKLAAVEKLKNEVEAAKDPLSACGLSFKPFQTRFDLAQATAAQARGVLDSDPERAEQLAMDAESALSSLLSDLKRAVELKNDHSLDLEIAETEAKIAGQRGIEVVWNYPGVNPESCPKQRYFLNEVGNNPDDFLGQARSERALILKALEAGNVTEADRHFNASHSALRGVYEIINRTLACKQRVETEMPTVLKETTDTDSGYADSVKTAYLSQQFNRSAQHMDALKRLIADRREARAIVERCLITAESVKRELADNDRYVTYQTNHKFDGLISDLKALANEVKQTTGDWATLRTRAENIESGLRQVRQEIADGKKNFEAANATLRNLRAALDKIPLTINISQPSRDKLIVLEDTYRNARRELGGAKKDWAKIKAELQTAINSVDELKSWIDEDNRKWQAVAQGEKILTLTKNLDRYSRSLNGRLYNGGIAIAKNDPAFLAHRQAAEQHLAAARQYWNRREWFGAEQQLSYLEAEYKAVSLIGWWSVLRMMRDSNDFAAQHYSFQGGFRDKVTWEIWRDKFISKQRVDANGLWEPINVDEWLRTGAGGADFTKAPDFSGYGGSDPWTPVTPTT